MPWERKLPRCTRTTFSVLLLSVVGLLLVWLHLFPSSTPTLSTVLTLFATSSTYCDRHQAVYYPRTQDSVPLEPPPQSERSRSVRFAFLGDSNVNSDARKVLELVRDADLDLIIHVGDYGYGKGPRGWYELYTEVFSSAVQQPFFSVFGNEDLRKPWWERSYANLFLRQMTESARQSCTGIVGMRAVCIYRNILQVHTSYGFGPSCYQNGPDWVATILQRYSAYPLKMCVFHANAATMTPGERNEHLDIALYEVCRKGGALVVTGHTHLYARTHILQSFDPPTLAESSSAALLKPGQTLSLVVGTGGSIPVAADPVRAKQPHWAKIFAVEQTNRPGLGAESGALFCTATLGKLTVLRCAFKDIEHKIADRFSVQVRSELTTELKK